MGWPVGRKNPALAESMRRYHAAKKAAKAALPAPEPKPSRKLELSHEERKVYEKLRRAGIDRNEALATVVGAPY